MRNHCVVVLFLVRNVVIPLDALFIQVNIQKVIILQQ